MTSTSSIRHLTHQTRTDVPAAAALELTRATVVARLMGLDAAWASSSTDKPGWWLEAWARQLAAEQLPPELEADLTSWLADVQHCLAEREAHLLLAHAERAPADHGEVWLDPWARAASALADAGAALEGRVACATGGTCEPTASLSAPRDRSSSGADRAGVSRWRHR